MINKKIVSVVLAVIVLVLIIILARKGASSPRETSMDQNQIAGLTITNVVQGTGAIAENGNTVHMNYTGKLEDGTVFDSSVDPKFGHVEPLEFQLGAGMVIQGWDKGILGMKEGEKRTLTIAPELGYGERGAGNVIPPNATLIFDVELVSITK